MQRRRFMTLVGTAAAWPLATSAQQPAITVGMLHTRAVDERTPEIVALRRGLVESGAAEGRNIGIEFRWTDQRDRLPALAAELIAKPVAVIIANGIAAAAAKTATTTL